MLLLIDWTSHPVRRPQHGGNITLCWLSIGREQLGLLGNVWYPCCWKKKYIGNIYIYTHTYTNMIKCTAQGNQPFYKTLALTGIVSLGKPAFPACLLVINTSLLAFSWKNQRKEIRGMHSLNTPEREGGALARTSVKPPPPHAPIWHANKSHICIYLTKQTGIRRDNQHT